MTQYRGDDLVLTVSQSVDPERNLLKYEPFIDQLCKTRSYQKDALRTAIRFFLGGQYASADALIAENYASSSVLQQVHGTLDKWREKLLFPDRLSASVDLATGTGKSYLLYGVAAIMLAEGAVDQVLVLCPSTTIESGLTAKFRELAVDADLSSALPDHCALRMPTIGNGAESVVPGSICLENFHAVLPNVGSSIRSSLAGKGGRTLVLNDEAHHLFSSDDMKRWTEFVADPSFAFKYVLGVSGTCYIDDDYFPDVIYRYSLREAIDAGFVKTIDYVAEDSDGTRSEKFQKIYDNHMSNKRAYGAVRPLTLLVTRDVTACKRLTSELIDFLASTESSSPEDVAKKVLAVTSDPEHRRNVQSLAAVDSHSSPVEWITSVSMLTEGWDVKNVFQIVPHEERAFRSKLLISQVLGRGLRVPDEYRGERPVVTVFNHDSWSARIRHLVDEILEIETRLYSETVKKSPDYDFEIHNIDYTRLQTLENLEAATEGEMRFDREYISLVSQVDELERETTYERAGTGEVRRKRTRIKYEMFEAAEVAEHILAKFRAIDLEEGTRYAQTYDLEWLLNMIQTSLRRVGEERDVVSEENRQRLQAAFGAVHRKSNQTVRYDRTPSDLRTVRASDRRRDSVSLSSLRRGDATIFFDALAFDLSDDATKSVLQAVVEDESLPRSAYDSVPNSFDFRTCQNIVITTHRPERLFVRKLVQNENASVIDGWIKSNDQGFYPIEFSWRRGDKTKRASFNPDFFISTGDTTIVVEIKGDEEVAEPSEENRAKYRAAMEHFQLVNARVSRDYFFHFLSPRDFDGFFQFLRDRNFSYRSELSAALASD